MAEEIEDKAQFGLNWDLAERGGKYEVLRNIWNCKNIWFKMSPLWFSSEINFPGWVGGWVLVGLVEIKAIFKLLQWLKAQIIIRRLKVETVEEFQMV